MHQITLGMTIVADAPFVDAEARPRYHVGGFSMINKNRLVVSVGDGVHVQGKPAPRRTKVLVRYGDKMVLPGFLTEDGEKLFLCYHSDVWK